MRQARHRERVADRQLRGAELAGGDVDRQPQLAVGRPGPVPLGHLHAGLEQHSRAKGDDRAGLLGVRDEAVGHQHAAGGVLPAGQRLAADHQAGAQVDHRLEPRPHLTALQREPQVVLHLEPLGGPQPHGLVEDLVAGPAVLLGAVHRRVGVADQQLGVDHLARRCQGNAHAGRDDQVPAVDLEGPAQLARDALHDRENLLLGGELLTDQDELVATEAGQGVGGAEQPGEPAGDGDQQLVAGGVAEAVVDPLEPVEVHEHDRDGAAAAVGQCAVEAVEQQRPVRQSGQRVVQRLVGERVLGDLLLGDVLDRADQPQRGRAGGAGHLADRRPALQPARAAVGAQEPVDHGHWGAGLTHAVWPSGGRVAVQFCSSRISSCRSLAGTISE